MNSKESNRSFNFNQQEYDDSLLSDFLTKEPEQKQESDDNLLKSFLETSSKKDDDLLKSFIEEDNEEGLNLIKHYHDKQKSEFRHLRKYYGQRVDFYEKQYFSDSFQSEVRACINKTLSSLNSGEYDATLLNFLRQTDKKGIKSRLEIIIDNLYEEMTSVFMQQNLNFTNLDNFLDEQLNLLEEVHFNKIEGLDRSALIVFLYNLKKSCVELFDMIRKQHITTSSLQEKKKKVFEEKLAKVTDIFEKLIQDPNNIVVNNEEVVNIAGAEDIEILSSSVITDNNEILTCSCGHTLEGNSVIFRTCDNLSNFQNLILSLRVMKCDKCNKYLLLPEPVLKELELVKDSIYNSNIRIDSDLTLIMPKEYLNNLNEKFYTIETSDANDKIIINYEKDIELKNYQFLVDSINDKYTTYSLTDFDFSIMDSDVSTDNLKLLNEELNCSENFVEKLGYPDYDKNLKKQLLEESMRLMEPLKPIISSLDLFIQMKSALSKKNKKDVSISFPDNKEIESKMNDMLLDLIPIFREGVSVNLDMVLGYPFDISKALNNPDGEQAHSITILRDALLNKFCLFFIDNSKYLKELLYLNTAEDTLDLDDEEEEEEIAPDAYNRYLSSLDYVHHYHYYSSLDEKGRESLINNYKIHNSKVNKERILELKVKIHDCRRLLKVMTALEENQGTISVAVRQYKIKELIFWIKDVFDWDLDFEQHNDLLTAVDQNKLLEYFNATMNEYKQLIQEGIKTGTFSEYTGINYSYTDLSKTNVGTPLSEELQQQGNFILTELRSKYGNDRLAYAPTEENITGESDNFEVMEYCY